MELKKCMSGMLINDNLQLAIEASLSAGQVIMEVYDSVIEIEFKEDKSPLTLADTKSNEVINSYLMSTKIPIISEENKQINYTKRKNWDVYWIVDPVDGTKEFIKRNGEFTVNISLVKNGFPQLGVIYVPAERTIYYADATKSCAFRSVLETNNTTIKEVIEKAERLRPKPTNQDLVKVVGSRSHMNQETLDFVEELKQSGKTVEIVSKGSSLKFCLVAEGKADVYPRYAPTMEWDTAAGQAICNAVGVEVISKETNKPLLYNKENLLNPWFLVSK